MYLRLDGVAAEATYDHAIVPIPVHVWEHARRFPGVDLSLADVTDHEIQARVESYVGGRIAQLADATDETHRARVRLAGSIPFGPADGPREHQIAQGLADYHRRRTYQRDVRPAIARLGQEGRGGGGSPPPSDGAEGAQRALSNAEKLLRDLQQSLGPDDPRRDRIGDVRAECRTAVESLER